MPTISYSTPTDKNGQAANTLFVEGSGLPSNATVTLSITATGSVAMTAARPTDASGAISALIDIVDPAIQALLPLLGGGSWTVAGLEWSTSASNGAETISMTCRVA